MKFFSKYLLKILGWKIIGGIPDSVKQCVIIAAPHTSNWDLFYGRLGLYIMGINLRFLIKKELFFFPLNLLLKSIGGIAVDRNAHHNMVDAMTSLFDKYEHLSLMFAPEGTRSRVDQWKTGFYHVARKAGVPIALGFIDYDCKIGGIVTLFHPSGSIRDDFREFERYYEQFSGKYPEKFNREIIPKKEHNSP